MSSLLFVYASTHGQTERIVVRLADRLRVAGHQVTVWSATHLPPRPVLAGYDGYLLAGSVRFGKYHRRLVAFARANADRLNAMPGVFVSVCGAMIGDTPLGRAEAHKYEALFARETGWNPSLNRSLPGAIVYTRYDWITRWVMKLINWRKGGPTDTSRDWDCTDWEAVDRLAEEVAELARSQVLDHGPATPVALRG